jgi:hypothetical protein
MHSSYALKNPMRSDRAKRIPLHNFGERARLIGVEAITSGGTILGLSSELKNLDKE